MFPNPSESSIADDIAHNLASQEIIGVGKKLTNFASYSLWCGYIFKMKRASQHSEVFPMLIKT